MKKKLYLLDAYALIYRGYFAFIRNPRINSQGKDTSAVFGFLLTFDEIRKKAKDDYLAVVFDPKGPTFRHETYPEYKAQREETPDSIRFGVPYIKEIIKGMGVQIYEVPRYEADDVIGTIAKRVGESGEAEVLMVTPDKDYGQLVSDNVFIYKPLKGAEFERIGPAEVVEKYGIRNHGQVIDLLALMGDASDNVPGALGVGEKTAAKLLSQYDDVDDIYAHVSEIKGKLGERLAEHEALVRLSRELVTIVTDAPVDFALEDCKIREIDLPAITRIYEELEIKTLLKKVTEEATSTPAPSPTEVQQASLFGDLFAPKAETPAEEDTASDSLSSYRTISDEKPEYHTVTTLKGVEDLALRLMQSDVFAFDTETDGLDALTAGIVGASFACKEGEAWYIPLPEDKAEATALLAPLVPLFARKDILKVGQNIKFDLEVLMRYGITPCAPYFDTMIAHYLLNPELSHGMDYMSENYLGYRPIPITDLIGPKGKKQLSMRDVPVEKVAPYAAEDADVTLRLYHFLRPQIEERSLGSLFYDLEMPLMEVLMAMEQEGVALNTAELRTVATDMEARLSVLEKDIYESAGVEFNINSPKVVGEVLFDRLGLGSKHKKTKTGNYATGEEILQKLKSEHPVVEMILRYRGLRKLLSTYVEALPELINPATGRIHTTYNQTVAATGRLSSTNPNLQNIPIRDDDGREIRKAFTAHDPQTDVFVSADYSQIELRLMAHLCGDEALVEAFRTGQDIHAATAAKIFGVALDEVTSEMRRRAKTANFGIIYGISSFGLSERLSIPRKEASELIDGYFSSYPKVKAYMDKVIAEAREKGYVETILGRRRYLKDIHAGNAVVRGYAERNAVNAPIQGSAADIIKLAMVRISERLEKEALGAKMILQVHDELNFSCPKAELDRLSVIIREEMEGVCPSLSVPLTVDIGSGDNWLQAH